MPTKFSFNDYLVIDQTGSVGIGTTSPTAKLDLTGAGSTAATNAILIRNSTGTTTFILRDDGTAIVPYISGSLTKLTDNTSYLVAGTNITITSQSNGSILISSAGGGSGGGDPSAQYLVLSATASLSNERTFTPGTGLTATDAGANSSYTLGINNSVVATISGSTFTGATKHNAGLSGSLTNLIDGTSYLVAGSNVTITSGSNGSITIASTGGGGGSVQWVDGDNRLSTTASVGIGTTLPTASLHVRAPYTGTIYFYDDFESGLMQPYFSSSGNLPWEVTSSLSRNGIFSIRSGKVTHGQSSNLMLTASNPVSGVIEFWYFTEQEGGADSVRFYVDEVLHTHFNVSTVAWRKFSATVTPGTHKYRWWWSKDSSIDIGRDGFFMDQLRIFESGSLSDVAAAVFESGSVGIGTAQPQALLHVSGGNSIFDGHTSVLGTLSAWRISGSLTKLTDNTSYLVAGTNIAITSQSNGSIIISTAGSAAQWADSLGKLSTTASVGISTALPTASLHVRPQSSGSVYFFEDFEVGMMPTYFSSSGNALWGVTGSRPNTGFFSAKAGAITAGQFTHLMLTSSNAAAATIEFNYFQSSEGNFDFLRFYIDETQVLQDSGIINAWRKYVYTGSLTPGIHTYRWTYNKDGSADHGFDTVWIDNIRIFQSGALYDVAAVFESGSVGIGTTTPGPGTKLHVSGGNTLFEGNVIVSGALNAISLSAINGLSGSLQTLVGGAPYLIAGSNVTITTASNGQITIASSGGGSSGSAGSGADPGASYVVLSATSSLANERVLTAGTGISITDNGPGSTIVISTIGSSSTTTDLYTFTTAGPHFLSASRDQVVMYASTATGSVYLPTSASSGDTVHVKRAYGNTGPLTVFTTGSWIIENVTTSINMNLDVNLMSTDGANQLQTIVFRASGSSWNIQSYFDVGTLNGDAKRLWNSPISPVDPTIGQALVWNGSAWAPGNVAAAGTAQSSSLNYGSGSLSSAYSIVSTSFTSVPGLTASLTTTGSPVLLSANILWVPTSVGPTAAWFTFYRDGVNIGHTLSGTMGVQGDGVETELQNASFSMIDTPSSGSHTYAVAVKQNSSTEFSQIAITANAIHAIEMSAAGSGGSNSRRVSTPILAGVATTTSLSSSKESIGCMYFDPSENGSGTRNYYYKAILESTTSSFYANVDLYDLNGIVTGIPGLIAQSVMSSSAMVPTQVTANLTSILQSVTGSGILEARLWLSPSGSSQAAICKNARLDIIWS